MVPHDNSGISRPKGLNKTSFDVDVIIVESIEDI